MVTQAFVGEQPVGVPLPGGAALKGQLVVPKGASSLVVFAHGLSGLPLSRAVARLLREAKLATLVLEQLTDAEEAAGGEPIHDVPPLAQHIVAATDWVLTSEQLCHLAVGCFGTGAGAAAALQAAADRPWGIGAVVACGGRLTLDVQQLQRVRAPTLLVVGGIDPEVFELNRLAQEQLHEYAELLVLPGAVFELDPLTRHARAWFARHLGAAQHEQLAVH